MTVIGGYGYCGLSRSGSAIVEVDPLVVDEGFERFVAAFIAHFIAVANPVTEVEVIQVAQPGFVNLASALTASIVWVRASADSA